MNQAHFIKFENRMYKISDKYFNDVIEQTYADYLFEQVANKVNKSGILGESKEAILLEYKAACNEKARKLRRLAEAEGEAAPETQTAAPAAAAPAKKGFFSKVAGFFGGAWKSLKSGVKKLIGLMGRAPAKALGIFIKNIQKGWLKGRYNLSNAQIAAILKAQADAAVSGDKQKAKKAVEAELVKAGVSAADAPGLAGQLPSYIRIPGIANTAQLGTVADQAKAIADLMLNKDKIDAADPAGKKAADAAPVSDKPVPIIGGDKEMPSPEKVSVAGKPEAGGAGAPAGDAAKAGNTPGGKAYIDLSRQFIKLGQNNPKLAAITKDITNFLSGQGGFSTFNFTKASDLENVRLNERRLMRLREQEAVPAGQVTVGGDQNAIYPLTTFINKKIIQYKLNDEDLKPLKDVLQNFKNTYKLQGAFDPAKISSAAASAARSPDAGAGSRIQPDGPAAGGAGGKEQSAAPLDDAKLAQKNAQITQVFKKSFNNFLGDLDKLKAENSPIYSAYQEFMTKVLQNNLESNKQAREALKTGKKIVFKEQQERFEINVSEELFNIIQKYKLDDNVKEKFLKAINVAVRDPNVGFVNNIVNRQPQQEAPNSQEYNQMISGLKSSLGANLFDTPIEITDKDLETVEKNTKVKIPRDQAIDPKTGKIKPEFIIQKVAEKVKETPQQKQTLLNTLRKFFQQKISQNTAPTKPAGDGDKGMAKLEESVQPLFKKRGNMFVLRG